MLGRYFNAKLLARRGVEFQSDKVIVCQWLIFRPPKWSSPVRGKMYLAFVRKTTMTDPSWHVSLKKVTHAFPQDANIPGGSPCWLHERTYPIPK